MKYLLMFLAVWSIGAGIYFGEVEGHFVSLMVGLSLGALLLFGALVLALSELPPFIRRRNKR
jgi:hypothetical protein